MIQVLEKTIAGTISLQDSTFFLNCSRKRNNISDGSDKIYSSDTVPEEKGSKNSNVDDLVVIRIRIYDSILEP